MFLLADADVLLVDAGVLTPSRRFLFRLDLFDLRQTYIAGVGHIWSRIC